MKCDRCGGMMAYETFYAEADEYFGWRCVSCGEIIDQVIMNNRQRQRR